MDEANSQPRDPMAAQRAEDAAALHTLLEAFKSGRVLLLGITETKSVVLEQWNACTLDETLLRWARLKVAFDHAIGGTIEHFAKITGHSPASLVERLAEQVIKAQRHDRISSESRTTHRRLDLEREGS